MAAVRVHLVERGTRQHVPQRPQRTVTNRVVIRIEQIAECRMEGSISRQVFASEETSRRTTWCAPDATSPDSHPAWLAGCGLRPSAARNIATTSAERRGTSPSDSDRSASKSDLLNLELWKHFPWLVEMADLQAQNASSQDARLRQKLQIFSEFVPDVYRYSRARNEISTWTSADPTRRKLLRHFAQSNRRPTVDMGLQSAKRSGGLFIAPHQCVPANLQHFHCPFAARRAAD